MLIYIAQLHIAQLHNAVMFYVTVIQSHDRKDAINYYCYISSALSVTQ